MSAPKLASLSPESFLLHLIHKVDALGENLKERKSMAQEIRTLEFWRAIIAECLSTFFYVFLVCSVSISWTGSLIGHQPNWTVMAMTSGFAMATLSQCFGHISGANVNPAVTCSFLITRKISPLRAFLYVIAQSGGSIAGAALLYGVSIPGHQGALGLSMPHEVLGAWQIFGVEFVLTFLVVFTIFATLDSNKKSFGSDSLSIGLAYLVCSLTGLPASGASMNPVRALGPAFVMNRWKHHWVYWVAPIAGGMLAGLIYEFIFDTKKASKTVREALDELEKDINVEDHYEEPEVKVSNKTIMAYNSSGSSHSTSGSSSSSGHQSNNTGYSSLNSGQQPYLTTAYPQFQHALVTHEGIYVTGNGQGPHGAASLPAAANYHNLNNTYIYGTRATGHNTLRHLPVRLEYSNPPNNAEQAAKF